MMNTKHSFKALFSTTLVTMAVAAATTITGLAASETAHAEDLLQIYQRAVENDPTLAAARASWEAAQEKIPQARAGFLPNVGAQGEANYNNGRYTQDDATGRSVTEKGTYRNYGYTVSASQPIFKYQSFVQYDQAKEKVGQADIVLRQKKQDLMLNTAQRYFDVLLAEIEVNLVQAQKQALSEQLDQVKSQYKVGVVAVTDVNESKAKFDAVRADEVTAKNRLIGAQLALQSIIGTTPSLSLAKMKDAYLPTAPQPNDAVHWTDRAVSEHPDVRVAESNAKLAGLDIKGAKAGHYPTVELVGSWQDNKATGQLDAPKHDYRSRNGQVGVRLNVPLFQGGYVSSTVREAASLHASALQELEAARRQAVYEAQSGFNDVNNAIIAVEAYRQAVDSAEVALKSVQVGRRNGIRTTLDVLNAQQTLFSNRRDLAESYFKYFNGYLKLKYAAGELGEEDLNFLNRALQ